MCEELMHPLGLINNNNMHFANYHFALKINILYRAHDISCTTFASLIHRCEEVSLEPVCIKT